MKRVVAVPHWPYKRDFACCRAKVDAIGRFPIGYCSPECERRQLVVSYEPPANRGIVAS